MPCYPYRENGRFVGFICTRSRQKVSRCSECGAIADILCDYPVGDDKTCDRNLCGHCAHLIAPDLHYCPGHYDAWQQWRKDQGDDRVLENVVPFKRI